MFVRAAVGQQTPATVEHSSVVQTLSMERICSFLFVLCDDKQNINYIDIYIQNKLLENGKFHHFLTFS